MMKYATKPGVITDIRIIPNTKPLKVTIVRDNADSNFEDITEFKWNLFGYKKKEMMLGILNKKKWANATELTKTLRRQFDEIGT